ncbi:hypothetical protein [Sphaerimonospora mesophila]|uniref:hypothetical protein n=1 Tax=Sphaerimonospora mesophila TaxID=37483 RepID=UPI0006E469FE
MRSRLTAALLLLLPVFFLAAGAAPAEAQTAAHRAATAYTALQWADDHATISQWRLPRPGVDHQQRVPRLQLRSGTHATPGGLAVLPAVMPHRSVLVTDEGLPAGPGLPVPANASSVPARAPPSTAQ